MIWETHVHTGLKHNIKWNKDDREKARTQRNRPSAKRVQRGMIMIERLINFRLAARNRTRESDHNGVFAAITTWSIMLINRIQLMYICMTSSARLFLRSSLLPLALSLRWSPSIRFISLFVRSNYLRKSEALRSLRGRPLPMEFRIIGIHGARQERSNALYLSLSVFVPAGDAGGIAYVSLSTLYVRN